MQNITGHASSDPQNMVQPCPILCLSVPQFLTSNMIVYEIECVNVGSDGSYIKKIFSFSKNKNVAIDQASKNAVHGIIFRGIPQNEVGCVSQPPLARHPNAQEKNREFFDDFFGKDGEYQRFVTLTTNGAVAPEDRLKVGKKEYKIGVIVSVDVSSLRKTLEAAGVIKGLSSGF